MHVILLCFPNVTVKECDVRRDALVHTTAWFLSSTNEMECGVLNLSDLLTIYQVKVLIIMISQWHGYYISWL